MININLLFANLPIRKKLMSIIMTITIIILALSFLILSISTYVSKRKEDLKDISVLSDVISQKISPVMIFKDAGEAKETLNIMQYKDSIILGCLHSKSGELIASYIKSKGVNCLNITNTKNKTTLNNINITKVIYSPRGDILGYLYIVADMRNVYRGLFNILKILSYLFILDIILAYFLAIYLQKFITKPLENLAQSAQAIDNDNYSVRATQFYNDECGTLTIAFNKMMDKIERRNIELKKKVEERTKELTFSIQSLQKANDDKKKWVQNIGHEIRTPIHGIIQFTNFGIKDINNDKYTVETFKNYFQKIQKSAVRLCDLIERLLHFGKLEAGKVILNKESNDLKEIAESVVSELEPQIITKEIKVILNEPYIPTMVICDKMLITQVVYNIISNAIKFSPIGGNIEISFKEANISIQTYAFEAISVSIKDNGVGIPEDEKTSIFDTFTQSSKTSNNTGGTGLGLSISREIITAHKGQIYAENNKDELGSVFTFILPYNLEQKTNLNNGDF